MKVNFNTPFTNYKGEAIFKDGKEQLMKDVLSPLLFDGHWLSSVNPAKKKMSYDLSIRIYTAEGETELTAEEAVLVKEGAQTLTAGGYAQIAKLIDE